MLWNVCLVYFLLQHVCTIQGMCTLGENRAQPIIARTEGGYKYINQAQLDDSLYLFVVLAALEAGPSGFCLLGWAFSLKEITPELLTGLPL